MKKCILISCFVLLIVFVIYAEEKPRVAVLPFEAIGTSENEAQVITSLLESELISTNVYEIIERTQLELILNEQSFSLTGCTDDSCAIEVGKLLSAELIIIGKLSKLGSKYIVNAKLIDVTLGNTYNSGFVEENKLENITDGGIQELAYIIAGIEYKPEVRNDLWFNRTNRDFYWQNQFGGGGIFLTGINYFFANQMSLELIAGISYYSYDWGDVETLDGLILLVESNYSYYFFNYILTPYIQAGLSSTTNFERYDVLGNISLGLQFQKWYFDCGYYFPLKEVEFSFLSYRFPDRFKLAIGIKV